MATLLKQKCEKETKVEFFDVDQELNQHGWRPFLSAMDAEKALEGKAPYTYLLRRSSIRGKFEISFVKANGSISHDLFTLIDPKYGIWRNGHFSHVGTLAKVIRDMMHCEMHVGQPL